MKHKYVKNIARYNMKSIKISLLINILIRIALIYFLVEVMMFPHDPRFEGKAIPLRNLIVVGSLSLVFPVLWYFKGRKKKAEYPFFLDNLYLSIFLLDMAGNSFNLYDTVKNFDLIAHFHGTGAFTALLFLIFRAKDFPLKKAILISLVIATGIHAALEAQEYFTDVFGGTHNVGGWNDTTGDLMAGFVGSFIYLLFFNFLLKIIRMKI